jgi:2-polyprenyl-3-methyl-5-hydroxy-6-metoxy-1,4-benzoquinol methylase
LRYELAVCPVCTTKDFVTIADEHVIAEQVETLWEFHTRRTKPDAPVRQFFDRAFFSQDTPLHLVGCSSCGTVMRSPRQIPDDLVDLYALEVPPASALPSMFAEQQRFYQSRVHRLKRLLGRRGRVMEVGSYLGGFLKSAQIDGWEAVGVDVNESANDFARSQGCTAWTTTLEQVSKETAYDVVAIWNCFDQLADPRGSLLHARALLEPGGIVTLRVPNGALYAELTPRRRSWSVLAHNNLLAFPYRHGFTLPALEQMLGEARFRMVEVIGDTLVPTANEHTRRWAVLEERIAKAFMRVTVPRALSPWLEVYATLSE